MDVGAQLRYARESRGLSIAALSGVTRIKARVLEGIERNDLSAVPPHPYDRGFVAAFAREVGLDPTVVVREFFAQFEQAPEATPPEQPPRPVSAFAAGPWDRWRPWAPAVGGLGLIVMISVLLTDRTEAPRGTEGGAVGTMGQAELPSPAARPGSAVRAPADILDASDINLATGAFTVVLEAEGPSWVAATVDGTRQLYQILPPGSTTTLRGREITMRVGDAGALRWSVNGRAPESMGAPGRVRNVRLTTEADER